MSIGANIVSRTPPRNRKEEEGKEKEKFLHGLLPMLYGIEAHFVPFELGGNHIDYSKQ